MVGAVIPRLYDESKIPASNEEADAYFDSCGAALLPDAVSCTVTEELDGQYELKMQYPVGGRAWDRLALRGLIGAKPNREDKIQPFRIYRITKPLSGMFTVYGRHISYDLSGVVIPPLTASGPAQAVTAALSNAVPKTRFEISTDIESDTAYKIKEPRSLRSMLLNADGSLLSHYKGDFAFDRYGVTWTAVRGQDRGAVIEYGKNLLDLNQEENCANVYTGVFPYCTYTDEWGDDHVMMLPEQVLYASGEYDYEHILPVDVSAGVNERLEEDQTVPTVSQLRSAAREYMNENSIGVPVVNLTVSYLNLEDTDEYKNHPALDKVALGDSVTVRFPRYRVDAKARVTRTVYNCLTNKYESVHIGSIENKVTAVIAGHGRALRELEKRMGG